MNREQQMHVLVEGPTNLFQRALLLSLSILADDDCIVPLTETEVLGLLELPARNVLKTMNELIKRGWVEPLNNSTYKIHPYTMTGLTAVAFKSFPSKENENSNPNLGSATENKKTRSW
jgi:hypothetical protein